MTDREKMYSFIIHREVEGKGNKLTQVATKLDINYNKAYKLLKAYQPIFEKDYDVMDIDKLVKMKEKAKVVLENARQVAQAIMAKRNSTAIAEWAFNMPITNGERNEFNAIMELVKKDEYLPVGYRKPKHPAPIISNPKRYVGFSVISK